MSYIYVITNNINNKQYVGKTNFSDISKRPTASESKVF